MKTTTLLNPETQARIQQINLGVDWPACTPERALRKMLTPENQKAAREIKELLFILVENVGHFLALKKSEIL